MSKSEFVNRKDTPELIMHHNQVNSSRSAKMRAAANRKGQSL